jgi:hypothetical protein
VAQLGWDYIAAFAMLGGTDEADAEIWTGLGRSGIETSVRDVDDSIQASASKQVRALADDILSARRAAMVAGQRGDIR